MSDVDDEVCFI